ncbi:MAG: polynucleotide adenylyltransferase [Kistimonas sp.]|nr:polynucleotide adenylyltransferase [Kistimonas sp.]
MKIYLVGGAVRDELLGLPVHDRDWVVTGATPDGMHRAGYKAVGQDFPVFLHPRTREEYALARTERKSGRGYKGFVFHTAPSVTLEEDLQRRDLTINAMARDDQGILIDPCNGKKDLESRILRHVSPAFCEDPVRILRLARFAARLAPWDFTIADSTCALVRAMVASGEADWLVPERIWQETQGALASACPAVYFLELERLGALSVIMPEISGLFSQRSNLSARALERAAQENTRLPVRLACAWVTADSLALTSVQTLCQRLKVPTEFSAVASLCAKALPHWMASDTPPADQRLRLLQMLDGFRRPHRFEQVLTACSLLQQEAGVTSALSLTLQRDLESCQTVKPAVLARQGIKGKALGEAIHKARLEAMDAAWKQ